MANIFKQQQNQATRDAFHAECQALIAKGQRVEAGKKYRAATRCSLPEAQRQLGMKRRKKQPGAGTAPRYGR